MIIPRTIFRFIYGAFYTFLYAILVLLLCVTPTDIVYQSFRNHQRNNIWIATVVYFIAVLVLLFVYVTRLHLNKRALAAIPKADPIEGVVDGAVAKMVRGCLGRSAIVAWVARPRVDMEGYSVPRTLEDSEDYPQFENTALNESAQEESHQQSDAIVLPETLLSTWRSIEHPGWSSPLCKDTPNVQYSVVLDEISGIFQAQAITAAPLDPNAPPATGARQIDTRHPDAISALLRPPYMPLREYLAHLIDLQVLPSSPHLPRFLSLYEKARYSSAPLEGFEFRELVSIFTELLASIRSLDLDMLDNDRSVFHDTASVHSSPTSHARVFRYTPAVDDENPSTGPSTRSASRISASSEDLTMERTFTERHEQPLSPRPVPPPSRLDPALPRPALGYRSNSGITGSFLTAPATPFGGRSMRSVRGSGDDGYELQRLETRSSGGSFLSSFEFER